MSVIPFTASSPESTDGSYTTEINDFSIGGDRVLILDVDDEQFAEKSRDGNATYNFRVGFEYKDYDDSEITTIGEKGKIYIRPGKAVIVKTREFVHFPETRYGLILPRVSLLQRGLSTVASKIDPGYHGNLAITVFNHGSSTEVVESGHKFCSLTLFDVGTGIRPYGKAPQPLKGRGKDWYKNLRDLYARNVGTIFAVYIAYVILASIFKLPDLYSSIKKLLQWILSLM